jgi:membrane-associated protease RseP (regulator of RpoE activity)
MTFYSPKFNPPITKFFYDLLWWIVLINLSLALTNMLPVGIFDGGRFFMLTVLAITGNKKIAEKSFKIATKFILALFVLLMVLWFIGIARGWFGF